jgi:hypothetical protein
MTFEVNGVEWHAANAANIVEQAILDFTIGIVDDEYVAHVQEGMAYMTPEEREMLQETMRRPSVLERIQQALGLTTEDIERIDVEALAAVLAEKAGMRSTLEAFSEFKTAAASAAGAHYGVIVEYLMRSEKGSTADEARTVSASHGVGGRTHVQTKRIRDMRAKHPVADKLCAATKLTWPKRMA